jgi:tRNA pseudouridine38-40 synthase
MRHIKLILQYDGTEYAGWQRQPEVPTIQAVVEESIARITGKKTKVTAAGRTDAGVHAIEQVASFKTGSKHPVDVFLRALNALLPRDVRVLDVSEVDEAFHPRYSAKKKRYIYILDLSPVHSAFLYRYSFHFPYRLNLDSMKEASEYLIGRKDFRAFQASGSGAKTTVREVYRIGIEHTEEICFLGFHLKGRFLRFSVEANAFLRYMVRNIVGTLLEVGKGKLQPSDILEILQNKDRTLAGPTLPSRGLFLEKVYY